MSLARQLAELKEGSVDGDCAIEALSSQSPGFVLFLDGPQSRQGFALSHLLYYRLAPRDAVAGDGADAAPQMLTLAFSTADVVLTGWRLERVTELIHDGKLAAVRTIPTRHVGLTGNRPAVVSIAINPLAGAKGGQ